MSDWQDKEKIMYRVIVDLLMSRFGDDPWQEGPMLSEWEAQYTACLAVEQFLRETDKARNERSDLA